MERICRLLPGDQMGGLRLKSLWDEYEARDTPEAKVVKDLDMFELALQGVEYERGESLQPIEGMLDLSLTTLHTVNDVRTLHPFFESTVPRISHPVVQEWAHEL